MGACCGLAAENRTGIGREGKLWRVAENRKNRAKYRLLQNLVLYQGTTLQAAEKTHVLYQGTTLVVPEVIENMLGFSP